MGITTLGISVIAANMTGSSLITHCAIGSGDTAYASGNTVLAGENERNAFSTTDLSAAKEVTYTTDWSPVEVSGLVIKEHAMMTAGSAMVNREVLTESLVMDGEAELQIKQTYKFFI